MKIKNLLTQSQEIWGDQKHTLSQIIVKMGKIFGDLCHWERNAKKVMGLPSNKILKKI